MALRFGIMEPSNVTYSLKNTLPSISFCGQYRSLDQNNKCCPHNKHFGRMTISYHRLISLLSIGPFIGPSMIVKPDYDGFMVSQRKIIYREQIGHYTKPALKYD